MKKLLFLLLLSPDAYSFYTSYCEKDLYNYLKLEHNYMAGKKDTEPRFKVTHGNRTNTNLKDFHATTESINETFFGITAFDDKYKSLYSYNFSTGILLISYLDTFQDNKKDNYNTEKESLINGTFSGSGYGRNYVYRCEGLYDVNVDKRNAKDIPSKATG
jgi:hypothetical protein